MKKLYHQTRKSLESTWNANSGADFDEDSFSGVNIDLETANLVDRRIQECKKTLD